MDFIPPSPLPPTYEPVAADRADGLLAELRREAIPGHLLHNCPVRVVAECTWNDDVLFQHLADPGRFTVAHLTYLGRPEIDSHHPTIGFDGTWMEFVEAEQRFED